MRVQIDENSGFCFGVTRAITMAQDYLKTGNTLCCLGDIVHNEQEVLRLADRGLSTITPVQFTKLKDTTVLIRAHGEPPTTYQTAQERNIILIDATCPVVLNLQQRIKAVSTEHPQAQIVIFGRRGHAEVIGLQGQAEGSIVVENTDDLELIDYKRDVYLFSQTTMSVEAYEKIVVLIKERMISPAILTTYNTICKNVLHRAEQITTFAKDYDTIIFVGGEKSSNARALYEVCKRANSRTYFVTDAGEIRKTMFEDTENVGICGGTSTPLWLMEECKHKIENYYGISD